MQITVIIPSNHSHVELERAVYAVCAQTLKPFELVIIDSSHDRGNCPRGIISVCKSSGIQLIYLAVDHAFPGKARNIGIDEAHSQWIALIDVYTLPRSDWLSQSTKQIESGGLDGVWGATIFKAYSFTERLFRDGLFGMLSRQTLPGSVVHRKVIGSAGAFIPWVRAGEDTDWMLRVKLMKLKINRSICVTTDYIGLRGLGFWEAFARWSRNYSSSKSLPHLLPQQILVLVLIYSLLLFLAVNWNNFMADWQINSPLYIPNITKITAVFPILLYIILRSLVIPLRRGVPIWQLLPFRFVLIALVCGALDVTKALIFSFAFRRVISCSSLRMRENRASC